MKINFNKQPGELSVAIDGRLDTVTAPQLERFLSENDSFVLDTFKVGDMEHSMHTFFPHIEKTDGFFIAKMKRGK